MFSLPVHEAGGVSKSTLDYDDTRQGVWETHANIFLLVIDIITWRKSSQVYQNEPIYQHESATTFIGRSDAMNTISTSTGGHWRPQK